MTENGMFKIAVHCLGVQAEQEVCEECDIYGNCHTDCKDVAVVAIKTLKEIQQYREIGTVKECRELASIVNKVERNELAKIIDEWISYRKIGTVEECREAVEKQRTKKIIIRDWNPTKCPTCGHELSTSLGDGYYKHPIFLERCPECGQAIQWDNLEGMEDE